MNNSTNAVQKHNKGRAGWNSLTGFTLIEMMLVLLIFMTVFGSIMQLMQYGRISWYVADTEVEVQQQIRVAMEKMSRELSQTNTANISINSSQDKIAFAMPVTYTNGSIIWGNQIQYFLGGTNNQQLLRTESGVTTILARNIINIIFAQPVFAVVSISLTAQKAAPTGHIVTKSLSSQINIRND
ncbi:MAG: prepilin-type N-terminal cleavage/methylation domain-containing protein [Candidatus Omnitrophota bacterium]